MKLTKTKLKQIIKEEVEALLNEKELSSKEREDLPTSDFVYPKEEKYPIPDISHARNALARVAQHGSSAEKAKVRAAVKKKFPSIDVGDKKK